MPNRVLNVQLKSATAVALILILTGCEKAPQAEAIPVEEYIKPDAGPTYVSATGPDTSGATFTDITESAGLSFKHVNGAFGKKWMPETMGSGGAFLDYNDDGWPDILLINGAYWPGHESDGPAPVSRLFENRGDGTFMDVTESTGLSKVTCYGMGTAIADYDGDGDQDIYITAVGENHLLRNDEGKFIDVTDQARVGFSACAEGEPSPWEWSVSALWLDYDRDGR
ncbi:MAG: FG-GAP repeat domain-containing protein, partial [Phycisphaerae bacterium]